MPGEALRIQPGFWKVLQEPLLTRLKLQSLFSEQFLMYTGSMSLQFSLPSCLPGAAWAPAEHLLVAGAVTGVSGLLEDSLQVLQQTPGLCPLLRREASVFTALSVPT